MNHFGNGCRDLRFQIEETKALLQRAEIELDAAELAKLQEATAGLEHGTARVFIK